MRMLSKKVHAVVYYNYKCGEDHLNGMTNEQSNGEPRIYIDPT
jgi:hypothetical protein